MSSVFFLPPFLHVDHTTEGQREIYTLYSGSESLSRHTTLEAAEHAAVTHLAEAFFIALRTAPRALSVELTRQHRTHQQAIISGIQRLISAYSGAFSDMRNQAAVNWAKKAAEIPAEFPFL